MTKRKQIITIGGRPGSGKSTAAKTVATELGFMHFSSGDLFRAISREHGQDILQSNIAAEKEEGIPKIDQLVDERLREIGKNEDEVVIDSRMAWHWMPYSFKVFLNLDIETAAERILAAMTPERIAAEHIPADPHEYAQNLQGRLDSETRRYKKIYDVDPYNIDNYDLVINTKTTKPDEVARLIIERYNGWLKG